MTDREQDYFARRAEQELQAAAAAQSDDVRRRHLDLARMLAAYPRRAER
jgi:hypothetical protein